MKQNTSSINGSLYKALTILECFTYEQPRLRLKEVSGKTGISQPTAYRLLNTMKEFGIIEQFDGGYTLGKAFLTFEGIVLHSMELRKLSLPYLEELSKATDTNANLALLDGHEIIYIGRAESQNNKYGYFHIGMRRPVYCTALGKVLISHSPEKVSEIFKRGVERHTLFTITEEKIFLEEIERVRLQGYATDFEEWSNGINCVAVPVQNVNGEVMAAISISGPTSNFPVETAKDKIPILLEYSNRLSGRLGSHSGSF
jgi:IclR family transcriptional regulator, KDG regulon repressor